jgi:hypothetical protein
LCIERKFTIRGMVMRRILPLMLWHFGLLASNRLFADVVALKDGRQISGTVESGNTQELHIKVEDQSQTIDIYEVQTIQFGVSLPAPATAPPPPKAATAAPTDPKPAPAQPNSLFLNDGTHVAGKWWSIDPADMHFLVDDQLQHYPRSKVSGVTFGDATLPPPPLRPSPSASEQPPAGATQPVPAPALARSSAGPPRQPPSLTRPAGSAPSAAPRGLSQPEELGMVYFWNGKVLIPLERKEAVERKKGSTQYWEMPGPQSPVRLAEAPSLIFILRLPKSADPASYSLFSLVTVDGGRRTRPQPGRRGALLTWPVDIEKNDESSLMTYTLTVRDLPTGEYSFSPSSSNDGYCFGVDPSAPRQ